MKRSIKKFQIVLIVLIIFVLGLSATGCDSGAGSQEKGEQGKAEGKGRYMETLLASPEKYDGDGSLCLGEEGELAVVDRKNGLVSTSSDNGKTWNTKENKILKQILLKKDAEITSAVLAPDGGLFISYILWKESTAEKPFPEKYIYVDPQGSKKEFTLGMEDYQTSIEKAVFTKQSRLFVATSDQNIYEIDCKKKKAEKRLEVKGGNHFGMFYYGNRIAVCDGKKVSVYDPETGNTNAEDAVLNEYIEKICDQNGTVILGGNAEDKLIVASEEGIYSHVAGGSVMEQLAEGRLITLGDPSRNPSELLVLENGSILIAYQDGELDCYTYDENASVVPEKQLKIYSLYDNKTVRRAISSFRKNHPDVYVKMETGVSKEDGVTVSDAVKNLNTELLAGNGPDVILMDGMPLESYIEKGTLLELSDILKRAEGESTFYDNVLKAYQRDGKLYAVPVRFKMLLLSGEKNTLSRIKDLKSMADVAEQQADLKTTQETVFGTYDAQELLKRLVPLCEGAWCADDGTVKKEAVNDFLTQAKRIYHAEQKNLSESEIQDHEERMESLQKYGGLTAGESDELSGKNQALMTVSGEQVIAWSYYQSMADLQMLLSVVGSRKQDSFQIFNGQMEQVFIPSGIAGISSTSKEQELAGEFFKEMLGKAVQGNDLEDGFPVNKDAFSSFSNDPNPDSSSVIGMGDDINMEIRWPKQQELVQVEKMFEKLQIPANVDFRIRDEVLDIAKAVLEGEKEIEDGTEEISQKLSLRMAE